MKTRILAVLSAAALAVGATGCTPTATDRPLIVVTTNILGDVVENIVGDEAGVLTLMKPNADPHSFEISAREASLLHTADLLVSNGLGLEEGLQQHLDSAAANDVPKLVAGDQIDALDYADGDAAGMPDSHFWTDPGRMMDVVAALDTAISDIEGVDPMVISANTTRYLVDLQDLDDTMADAFTRIPENQRALVTNHHVFGYLADRFGFRVIGAIIPGGTTLAAPSASDLRDLVSAVNDAGVRTIFAESSQPDRLAQVLADEAGLDVSVVELYTESLTAPGDGAEDYLTMMQVNTDRIVTGLS
ncbi:zinc/manganese transport system substrate-binding protein [Okibacterium sp. HSC-33S16]|uniref:zinc ABC transporter substrate-binding protein AztC n=1 Tax=Okibacterium sp. HSC-33S16 TaxID=2910965 RepID=UPI00209FA326|nr:zinc ABC transporter substrate-binding protein AztC [Okibacterium sp. HSC-33S16]MCP2032167.1 zinc/manganese transport system substrate-binding protein [Okibacterium sp. HSC-33S16]